MSPPSNQGAHADHKIYWGIQSPKVLSYITASHHFCSAGWRKICCFGCTWTSWSKIPRAVVMCMSWPQHASVLRAWRQSRSVCSTPVGFIDIRPPADRFSGADPWRYTRSRSAKSVAQQSPCSVIFWWSFQDRLAHLPNTSLRIWCKSCLIFD